MGRCRQSLGLSTTLALRTPEREPLLLAPWDESVLGYGLGGLSELARDSGMLGRRGLELGGSRVDEPVVVHSANSFCVFFLAKCGIAVGA
jgi:hypothetical protein